MARSPRRRPSLEALEDRNLPAAFGIPWPDPGHLTLSLVPDGTPVGSQTSSLNAALGARLPAADWKRELLRAFQTWADAANLNIGVVPDSGQPAGQPGPLQGNPGFGDLRVSARPLSPDVLAVATPFDLFNNWSGNVILNSAAPFTRGGADDLFSVALHEAGHALGLDHNDTDPTSAMYPDLTAPHTGPNAADVAALRALYGARAADPFEGGSGDDARATATPLAFADIPTLAGSMPPSVDSYGSLFGAGGPNGRALWAANADLAGPTDTDLFAVTVPAYGGTLAAVVHAAGVSMLTPRVSVLDAKGNVVASALSTDPLSNDVTVTVAAPTPGATYYLRVEPAGSDAFGAGAYRVAVGSPTVARFLALLPTNLYDYATNPNKATRFDRAVDLTPRTPGTDARWRYVVRDGLSAPTETDFYGVPTDPTAYGALLVTVWGLEPGGLAPKLTVLDATGKPVTVQILHRDASSASLQIPAVTPGARYVVEVSAADPAAAAHAVGGYFLGVTPARTPITLLPFAEGTLDATRPKDFRTLTIPSAELFHFDLAGDPSSASAATAVRMTVFDANKNPVYSLRAYGGAGSATGDVVLSPGTYVVRFGAATRTGAPLPVFSYRLRGTVRSDPIGPAPTDPTLTPTGTTTCPDPYGWVLGGDPVYADFLKLTDVLSNPWM